MEPHLPLRLTHLRHLLHQTLDPRLVVVKLAHRPACPLRVPMGRSHRRIQLGFRNVHSHIHLGHAGAPLCSSTRCRAGSPEGRQPASMRAPPPQVLCVVSGSQPASRPVYPQADAWRRSSGLMACGIHQTFRTIVSIGSISANVYRQEEDPSTSPNFSFRGGFGLSSCPLHNTSGGFQPPSPSRGYCPLPSRTSRSTTAHHHPSPCPAAVHRAAAGQGVGLSDSSAGAPTTRWSAARPAT